MKHSQNNCKIIFYSFIILIKQILSFSLIHFFILNKEKNIANF